MPASQIPTVYEWAGPFWAGPFRAGGIDRIRALFQAFYARVPSDPVLGPVFAQMPPEHFETVHA